MNPESFARFNVNGLTALVPGNQERIQTPIRTIEINENQTWIRGSHQIKYGFNWRYSRNIDDQNNRTGGQFVFNSRGTGVGTAELLLGHVTARTSTTPTSSTAGPTTTACSSKTTGAPRRN